jgi:hypothetical protein
VQAAKCALHISCKASEPPLVWQWYKCEQWPVWQWRGCPRKVCPEERGKAERPGGGLGPGAAPPGGGRCAAARRSAVPGPRPDHCWAAAARQAAGAELVTGPWSPAQGPGGSVGPGPGAAGRCHGCRGQQLGRRVTAWGGGSIRPTSWGSGAPAWCGGGAGPGPRPSALGPGTGPAPGPDRYPKKFPRWPPRLGGNQCDYTCGWPAGPVGRAGSVMVGRGRLVCETGGALSGPLISTGPLLGFLQPHADPVRLRR